MITRLRLAALIPLVALVLALVAPDAAAHPKLVRATPAPDALLAAPPARIELWFSERVDTGAGSPAIALLDELGNRTDLVATVDPADPHHVVADAADVGFGAVTVVWSVRSLDDGHTLGGSFAYKVGGSDRAPGAATVAGERPAPWNVLTRWLTFLGLSLTAGSGILARLLGAGAAPEARRRWDLAAFVGAVVALAATAIEPLLQTVLAPAAVTTPPTLTEAMAAQPAWFFARAGLLVVAALLAGLMLPLATTRRGRLRLPAAAAALAAATGLAATGHAAGRDEWRSVAIAISALHLGALALWVGGVLLLALGWSAIDRPTLVRFSRAALPLALVAIAAGIANSVAVLPQVASLWATDYGRVVLFKAAVLVPLLALATVQRAALRATVADALAHIAPPRMRGPLRGEAALLLMIVLAGSSLALLATPTVAVPRTLAVLDLGLFNAPAAGEERIAGRLVVDPARPGENTLRVTITAEDGTPPGDPAVAAVRVELAALTSGLVTTVDLAPAADGWWEARGMQLSVADWWWATITVRRAGLADATLGFALVLPDPNVNGNDAVPDVASDPAAEALFAQALARYTGLHRVAYTQRLTGGTGIGVETWHLVNDGSDGSVPSSATSTTTATVLVIGRQRWIRTPDGRWQATEGNPIIPPSEWGEDYTQARGFRLGRTEVVDGHECRVVVFFAPEIQGRAAAWYAWWVDVETGDLRRQAMVSRMHYMIDDFTDLDGDIVITAPDAAATPVS